MLKCREVPAEVSLNIDAELPWRRRLALRIHVLMCSHCRRYLRQARQIATAWRSYGEPASEAEVSAVLDACRDQDKNMPEEHDE